MLVSLVSGPLRAVLIFRVGRGVVGSLRDCPTNKESKHLPSSSVDASLCLIGQKVGTGSGDWTIKGTMLGPYPRSITRESLKLGLVLLCCEIGVGNL